MGKMCFNTNHKTIPKRLKYIKSVSNPPRLSSDRDQCEKLTLRIRLLILFLIVYMSIDIWRFFCNNNKKINDIFSRRITTTNSIIRVLKKCTIKIKK